MAETIITTEDLKLLLKSYEYYIDPEGMIPDGWDVMETVMNDIKALISGKSVEEVVINNFGHAISIEEIKKIKIK